MHLNGLRTSAYLFLGLVTAVLVLGGVMAVSETYGRTSSVAASAQSKSAPACASTGLELANSYGRMVVVSGSYQATAEKVAKWQEKSRGPNAPHVGNSPWRTRSDDEPVAVCYYDGVFDGLAVPGGPPGLGATAAPIPLIDRIIVLVDRNGLAELYAAGPRSSLRIENPN